MVLYKLGLKPTETLNQGVADFDGIFNSREIKVVLEMNSQDIGMEEW